MILAFFRALPLVWQLATGVAVVAAIGGGITYWVVHERNIGWNKAVDAIAAKDRKGIDAARKSISDVDACAARGGTWDTVGGVCN